MQIGVIFHARRENAETVLALGFAVKLLPPFRHHAEARLVAREDLHGLAALIERLARGGVLPAGVRLAALVERGERLLGDGEDLFNVDARGAERQQADGGEHAVAPADVVGNDEALPPGGVRLALESAAARVGRGEDAGVGLFLAVFLHEKIAEHAEAERRLKRRAGFGNDVHAEIAVSELFDRVAERRGGKPVSGKEQLRAALAPADQLIGRACAEIRSADADNDERVALFTDRFARGENARKLRFADAARQLRPAEKIRTRARLFAERAVRRFRGGIVRGVCAEERRGAGEINMNHWYTSLRLISSFGDIVHSPALTCKMNYCVFVRPQSAAASRTHSSPAPTRSTLSAALIGTLAIVSFPATYRSVPRSCPAATGASTFSGSS